MLFFLSKTKKMRSEINLVIKNIKESLQEENIEQDIIDLFALESLFLLLYYSSNVLTHKQSKELFDYYSTELLFINLLHDRLRLYKNVENKSISLKSVWLLENIEFLDPTSLAFGDFVFYAWQNNDLAKHYQAIVLNEIFGKPDLETYFTKFIIFSSIILPLVLQFKKIINKE